VGEGGREEEEGGGMVGRVLLRRTLCDCELQVSLKLPRSGSRSKL